MLIMLLLIDQVQGAGQRETGAQGLGAEQWADTLDNLYIAHVISIMNNSCHSVANMLC